MTDKILIVGSSGPISSGLAARYANRAIVVGRGPCADQHFDLEDSNTFGLLSGMQARHAVFLSAFTGFKPCEDDPYRAFRTNVRQTSEAIAILNAKRIPVTFLSSSAVFGKQDREKDEQTPAHSENIYGITKRLAERDILSNARNSVVRLTKLCDKNLPVFRRWRESVRAGNKIVALKALRLAPLPLSVVIDHLEKIIEQRVVGVTHLTSDKDLSYYELAEALFPGAEVAAGDEAAASAGSIGESVLAVRRAQSEVFDLRLCIKRIEAEMADAGMGSQ
jgi:dTDP-4-dehydrorhamnose reductase